MVGHRVAKVAVGNGFAAPPHRMHLGQTGDVVTLCHDGGDECGETLDCHTGGLCDILDALASTQPGLDVPGSQCTVHVDLHEFRSWQVTYRVRTFERQHRVARPTDCPELVTEIDMCDMYAGGMLQ